MKKRFGKIISIILIVSMVTIESGFTSFGVSIFSFVNKKENQKIPYYQMLDLDIEENNKTEENKENNLKEKENQIENKTDNKTDNKTAEEPTSKEEQTNATTTNDQTDDENIDNIEPSENNNTNNYEEEPEEDQKEDKENAENKQQDENQENNIDTNKQNNNENSNEENNDINNIENNNENNTDNNTDNNVESNNVNNNAENENAENISHEENDKANDNNNESNKDNDNKETSSKEEETTKEDTTTKSEEGTENTNTDKEKVEEQEKQQQTEKSATESEIENAGLSLEEIDSISTESEAENIVKSISENISTESEVKVNTDIDLATYSETISTNSEMELATRSELEEYILMDSLAMINYFGGNATKEQNTITLNADIKTKYPIIFSENDILNLNSHDIQSEGKGYAIIVTNKNYHVENEEIVFDDIKKSNDEENKTISLTITDNNIKDVLSINATIMKDITDKETIYVDNAKLSLNNVKIHAAEAKNCIYLNNSNFEIQNSYVFGGNGNATEENGGAGIYAKLDNDSYTLNLVSGSIRGGNGAPSDNENKIRAAKALESSFISLNVYEHTTDGKACDAGCGYGGCGIYVDNEEYDLERIAFGENMTVGAGDGGKKILFFRSLFGVEDPQVFGEGNESIFGNTSLSKFFLGKPGEESEGGNGTELSMVSPLKNQGSTNLCNVFSYIAAAETYLMKNYRTYVNTMIPEDSSDLDFSEEALAFGLYHYLPDVMNNAPNYIAVDMKGYTYKTAGTNPDQLDVTLTNLRGAKPESEAIWIGNNLYHEGDIDLSINNNVAHLYEDEKTYRGNYTDTQSFINDMKKKIYDGGIIFATFLGPSSSRSMTSHRINLNELPETAKNYFTQNYGTLPNTCTFYSKTMPPRSGGHTMYMVGWDDNFPKECFPESYRPAQDGAFIIKNSWNEWDFMSYSCMLNEYTEFHHTKWFPAYKQFENVYFYDTSYGQYAEETTECYINYKAQSNGERLQAVSIMAEVSSIGSEPARLEISKVASLTKKPSTVIGSKQITIHNGLNYYDLSDLNIIFNQGDCYNIHFISNSNVAIRIHADREQSEIVASYSTTYANHLARYGYLRSDGSWSTKVRFMIRIKAYTNNKYALTLDADGGQFTGGQGTKTKDIYLTDKINIENLEIPQKANSYFAGWYETKPSGENEYLSGTYEIQDRSNKVFKASWSEIEQFRAIFNVDSETAVHPDTVDIVNPPATQMIRSGNKIIEPASPSSAGFVFLGWYKEPSLTNAWDFNTDITEETILYAKWKAIDYNIKFDLMGYNATTPAEIKKTYKTNVTLPRPTNIQVGHKFAGWYIDKAYATSYAGDSDLTTIENDTKTVFAKWEEGYEQHTIYFNANGGRGYMAPQVVNEGVEFTLHRNEFTKQGYSFIGWTSNLGGQYDNEAKITTVTSDLSLTAVWDRNTGGGGNGGGGGGGGSVKVDENSNSSNEQIKAEANQTAKKEVENVALARGITLEAIANKPVIQQFITVESQALEYKKTVENILANYNKDDNAKNDVFTPANQTALVTKTAEKKLTNFELVKDQTTGEVQLLDKATNKAVTNCWQEVELEDKTTKWYKVDAKGNLETGIVVDGNKIYLLDELNAENYGAMVTGNYNIGMLTLEFKQDGSLSTMNYNEILLQHYLNMLVTAAIIG